MSKQILEQIQDVATQRKTELAGLEWRDQVKLYNKIVAQVSRWQKKMCEVFGTPTLAWKPSPIDDSLSPTVRETLNSVQRAYLRWQDGLVSAEELRGIEVKFRGACIVQTQEILQTETEAIVHYVAKMQVDENHFFEASLPSTKSLIVHDPEYTLFDFQIHVPRGELIKESLHAISRAMRRHKKTPPVLIQPPFYERGIITLDTTPNILYSFNDNTTSAPTTVMSSLNSILPSTSSFAVTASSSANLARTLY